MDYVSGNKLLHPNMMVDLYGNAGTVRGKIGGALQLDGNSQYADFGNQGDSCFGNLDLCQHGMHLAMWLRPGQLNDNMDLIHTGSNGMKVWYANGRLHFSFKTTTQEWKLSTDQFDPLNWQFLEWSWSEDGGIKVYVNTQLVASTNEVKDRPHSDLDHQTMESENFYLGRGDGLSSRHRYGNMTLDEMEYWYGNRDYLLAFDYIQRGNS